MRALIVLKEHPPGADSVRTLEAASIAMVSGIPLIYHLNSSSRHVLPEGMMSSLMSGESSL